jgi:hypothetical protein
MTMRQASPLLGANEPHLATAAVDGWRDWIVSMAPDHSGTASRLLSCALSGAPRLSERVDGTLVMHR